MTAVSDATPEWVRYGHLRWVWGLWEPIALYSRGGHGAGIGDGMATGHWVPDWYLRMHSDEILDKLADMGVNCISTHYYKGFGLKAEAEEQARTADLVRRCHERGIRVLGYHQFSTLIYETFLDEVPAAKSWIQRGPSGELRTYGSAYWRWLACPQHDEFIAYLKRVMKKALLEADLDGIEFDGTTYDCHCELCQREFREWLAERHPAPLERFGIPHFRHVRIPPTWNRKDPLWQEWVRFRIDVMGERLRELRAYTHKLKPDAAFVTYVDLPGLFRTNRTRLLPDSGDYLDLGVAESHDMPQVLDGELITKVRHLKEATAHDRVVLSTQWLSGVRLLQHPIQAKRDMAEMAACGGQMFTATYSLRSGDKRDGSAVFERPELFDALKQYMGFFKAHEHLYAGSESLANVWVYHSTWSLAFDHANAYNSTLGVEQALILDSIAYRIAKRVHLAQLGDRDVLILANQTCLGDDEVADIREAITKRGVRALITGLTSECDENFRQRRELALADVFDLPNVTYIADCPGRTSQPEYSAGSPMRARLPKRHAEITDAVRRLALWRGLPAREEPLQSLAAQLKGPGKHFVDVYRVASGAVVAHLVNYEDKPADGLRLAVAPWLGDERESMVYVPERDDGPVRVTVGDDGWLSVPPFEVYCAVVFGPGDV